MKRMNKILAFLLCAVMLVAAFPMGVMAEDVAETTESAATESTGNVGYLWDFEDKEVGVTLSNDDFEKKLENIVWGGEAAYLTANWQTMADPEDADNIVLNPLLKRPGSAGGNSYYTNAIQFKNFDEGGRIIELSYDFYMTARSKARNDIPLFRVCYNGVYRTLVALDSVSAEVAPGDENTTTATSMGKVQLGDNNYSPVTTKVELFAKTWYNIRLQFDTFKGCVVCYIDDALVGSASVGGWSPATHKIDYLIGLRCYDANHALTAYVDDIYLGYLNEIVKSDFKDTTDFGYPGYPLTTAQSGLGTWSVNKDGDNSYLKHTGTHKALTWSDGANWLDRGVFSYSFDYKCETSSSGGLLSVLVDRASGANEQEFRIIHQNGSVLTLGPTNETQIGLNIARITTGASAKWHNIKTVFKPFIRADYINMNYEFYLDGDLAAYTEVIEGVDDDGNNTYCYNFYTKVTGQWAVKADIQPAKYMQYFDEKNDDYAFQWVVDAKSPWRDTTNNAKRAPVGFWDGYYKGYIDGEGTSGIVDRDGKIAQMTGLYMFHFNSNTFYVDNIKIGMMDQTAETVENAEMVGYQLGDDGQSVRFIAGIDSLDFGQAGMDIEAFEPLVADGWVTQVGNKWDNRVYMAVTADGKQLAAKEAFGTRFITMLSILEIDSSAIIRVHPYVTKDSVKQYGDPVVYSVVYDEKKGVTVTPVPTYVRDYDDGVVKGGISDGYSKSNYEQLVNADGDWGQGGEGAGRSASGVDGTMKILVPRHYTSYSANNETKYGYVSYVDEETGKTVYVLDSNGNKIYKYNTMSARYKLANVIPSDYSQLIGNTLIISARVRVAETKKIDRLNFNVTADNGKDYNVPTTVEYKGGVANLSIGFGDDAQWSYLGTAEAGNYRFYYLPVSDEWVEIYASIDVTEEFVAKMGTKNDTNGVAQRVPLRPTITVGNQDGWASELYVDDVTCVVVPTDLLK